MRRPHAASEQVLWHRQPPVLVQVVRLRNLARWRCDAFHGSCGRLFGRRILCAVGAEDGKAMLSKSLALARVVLRSGGSDLLVASPTKAAGAHRTSAADPWWCCCQWRWKSGRPTGKPRGTARPNQSPVAIHCGDRLSHGLSLDTRPKASFASVWACINQRQSPTWRREQ